MNFKRVAGRVCYGSKGRGMTQFIVFYFPCPSRCNLIFTRSVEEIRDYLYLLFFFLCVQEKKRKGVSGFVPSLDQYCVIDFRFPKLDVVFESAARWTDNASGPNSCCLPPPRTFFRRQLLSD